MSRFAHFLALEARELSALNDSTPTRELRTEAYRVPRVWSRRVNGTLIVLNGWGHTPSLLSRIASTLTSRGPTAIVYGDDSSWSAEHLQAFRGAIEHRSGSSTAGSPPPPPPPPPHFKGTPYERRPRLARYFAMNIDASAARLPFALQIPIGLNAASADLPDILSAASAAGLQSSTAHRSRKLLCCCQRAWPQRAKIFTALVSAGHAQCNLSERRPYRSLFDSYLRHRFVVSAYGHGRTDFREWEILLAGAVPVVQYFPEHDALLRGLPVVRVTDWSTVTPSFLDREWYRLQREAREGKVGLAKAYFPFWFAQFTAHMAEPSVERDHGMDHGSRIDG